MIFRSKLSSVHRSLLPPPCTQGEMGRGEVQYREHKLFRWLRWLVAGLSFIECRELLKAFWTANKTLRFGPFVLLAPITVFFEFGNQRRVAQRTLLFGYTVFDTPPASMTKINIRGCCIIRCRSRACSFVATVEWEHTQGEQTERAKHSGRHAAILDYLIHHKILLRQCRTKVRPTPSQANAQNPVASAQWDRGADRHRLHHHLHLLHCAVSPLAS